MKKKSSKNDYWKGMVEERTNYLVRTVDETKESIEKLHNKLDEKFKDMKKCVDEKFEKHNTHHVNKEKKYRTYFLIISALAIGAGLSNLSNPENAKFVWNLLVKFIGIF